MMTRDDRTLTREEQEIWELVSHFPDAIREIEYIPKSVQMKIARFKPGLMYHIDPCKADHDAVSIAAGKHKNVYRKFAFHYGFRFDPEISAHAMIEFPSIANSSTFWRDIYYDAIGDIAIRKLAEKPSIPFLFNPIPDERMFRILYESLKRYSLRKIRSAIDEPGFKSLRPIGTESMISVSHVNTETMVCLIHVYPESVLIPGFIDTFGIYIEGTYDPPYQITNAILGALEKMK